MQKDSTSTFHEELRSFFALSILNIVFAALTMALGISTVVTHVLQMVAAGAYVLSSPGLLLGAIATVVGFTWLPESARMLGDVANLRDEAREIGGRGDDEAVLRLMIGMIAIYRNRRSTVQRMIIVSEAGGAIFLVLGLFSLAIVLTGATDPLTQVAGILGAGINIAIGMAALYTSLLIGRYSTAWEARLEESVRAEAALTHALERD